jgi:hypothetical protein
MAANIYVIRDKVCNCDCFVFLETTDGAAKRYCHAWCSMQSHKSFTLIRIADIEFVPQDAITTDCYTVTHAGREELLDCEDLAEGTPHE